MLPVELTSLSAFAKLKQTSDMYTITPGETNTFTKKLTVRTCLSGGQYDIIENSAIGDYLEVSIVDIDNILGYGENYTLGKIVEQEYINPGVPRRFIDGPFGVSIQEGLYLVVNYISVGEDSLHLIMRYFTREN